MQNLEYVARVDDVKRRAHGCWTEILAHLGVDECILKKRNMPCPICGGTDRFQYTDKFGEGNYHCRSCGAGGGFKLLQAIMGSTSTPHCGRLNGAWGQRLRRFVWSRPNHRPNA